MRQFFNSFIDVLGRSKHPLILVGGGARLSSDLFKQFLESYQIPVVMSLLGLDVLPYNHPQRVGFIGTYGNRWANRALGTCDLLLVLGSRLDSRQTGERSSFGNRLIYHVDIDSAELNNNIKGCVTLRSDLSQFLQFAIDDKGTYDSGKWVRITDEIPICKGINPNAFIRELSQLSPLAGAFIADVGSNQMWCAQSLRLQNNQRFITSGGMGAMGYSLPAAIGASIALKTPIVAISGDGGFQINIQELETIERNNLPIKMVILNNGCLGMIRQFQDAYFESRYQSTVTDYGCPDFNEVARAYDIDSSSITFKESIKNGLSWMWKDPMAPYLLNVNIDMHTDVQPKVLWGDPLTKMD